MISPPLRQVAVLFARRDSIYKTLPACDVWDIDRDALKWPGGAPLVAHPPCRAYSTLRKQANPPPGEAALALFAVHQVRSYGGILEHPIRSTLWSAASLPLPGCIDEYGGWTMPILQFWFGHRAAKATWLYIVGHTPHNLPPFPLVLGEPTHVIATSKKAARRPEVTKAEREHTPIAAAEWFVDIARTSKRVF